MATYYMRADGTAANKAAAQGPASDASACMSVATHNGETFSAGDTIYLSSQGGTYTAKLTVASSGTSGNPIIYQAVASEVPVIDVGGLVDGCFSITDKDYITVDGLTLKNATTRCLFIRAETTNVTGFTVQNCIFNNNATGQGIQLFPEDYNVSNITISNCTFSNIDSNGINSFHAGATNTGIVHTLTIEDCTFDTLTHATDSCRGVETFFANMANALSDGRLPYGVTIQNNTFNDTNSVAIRLWCTDTATNLIANNTVTSAGMNSDKAINAFQLEHCKGLTVEYNTISNTGTAGPGDGNGIILDWANGDSTYICEDVIVRYNRCFDNDDSNSVTSAGINVYRAKNCEIYYNICDGNNRGMMLSFDAGNPSAGNVFYNNTIVSNKYQGVLLVTDCPTSTWTNNIIANNGAEGVDDNSANDPTFTYNCLYNNTGGNYSGFTLGAGCIELDPKFKSGSDYLLQPNSPCKDKGDKSVWTGTASIKDYAGNRITNAGGQIVTRGLKVSMGANQHQYNKSIRKPILSTILKKLKFMR